MVEGRKKRFDFKPEKSRLAKGRKKKSSHCTVED